MSVLLDHFLAGSPGYAILHGEVAVQVFYIISGFYMTLVLNEKYVPTRKGNILFFTNRTLRIYPTYWLILFVSVIFYVGRYRAGYHRDIFGPQLSFFGTLDPATWAYVILSQIAIFFSDLTSFVDVNVDGKLYFSTYVPIEGIPGTQLLFIPPAWTLSLELLFYLLAPLLVRRQLRTIVAVIAFSEIMRVLAYLHGHKFDPWTSRFFPFELSTFLLGAVSYHFLKKLRRVNLQRYRKLFLVLVFSFFALSFAYPLIFDFEGGHWIYYLFVVLIIPVLFLVSSKSKWDLMIGDLSYPIYLVHILVLSILSAMGMGQNYSKLALATVLSVLISIMIEFGLNHPIDRYRQYRLATAHVLKKSAIKPPL